MLFYLSFKPDCKSIYSIVQSVVGSASSFSSFSNFPSCCSTRISASVYADYLKSHVSVSQPVNLPIKARGYLSEVRWTSCPENFHYSFSSLFTFSEFFVAAANLFFYIAAGPDKVAYPMLKHIPHSHINLLRIFNLFWSWYSFPFVWKSSSIFFILNLRKSLDSPAFFRLISLTLYVPKLFVPIILSGPLFFES